MKQLVFMWTKSIWIAIFSLGVAILFSSCSGADTKPESKRVPEAKAPTVKKTSGVVYKPSPLAKEMRRMFANMEVANEYLKSGEIIPDSLLFGYEGILTAEATNPADINDTYKGFARGWLSEVEALRKEPTVANYNAATAACVNCHQEFCPGPISKIQKLHF